MDGNTIPGLRLSLDLCLIVSTAKSLLSQSLISPPVFITIWCLWLFCISLLLLHSCKIMTAYFVFYTRTAWFLTFLRYHFVHSFAASYILGSLLSSVGLSILHLLFIVYFHFATKGIDDSSLHILATQYVCLYTLEYRK